MSAYRYTDHSAPDRSQLTEIRIPLPDGEPIASEWVWALPLGGDLYRIENVVVWATEMGLHDEVIAIDLGDGPEVVEVVERRTHLRFTFNLENRGVVALLDAQPFRSEIAVEHAGHGLFVANLPDRSAAGALQGFLEQHAAWFERVDNLGTETRWDTSLLPTAGGHPNPV